MKENADKARGLDTAEIHKQLGDTAEQMFRLRFQLRMGQMEGLKKMRTLRKDRARMLTVLRERELHPEAATPQPVQKKAAKAKAPVKSKAKAKAPAKPKPAAKAKTAKTAAPKTAKAKTAKTKASKTSKG